MKTKIYFLILLSFVITSCSKNKIEDFYQENELDQNIIQIIKILGEDKICKIEEEELPYRDVSSFHDLKKIYYSDSELWNIEFEKLYSTIFKKNLSLRNYTYIESDKFIFICLDNVSISDNGRVKVMFMSPVDDKLKIFLIHLKKISREEFYEKMKKIDKFEDVKFTAQDELKNIFNDLKQKTEQNEIEVMIKE